MATKIQLRRDTSTNWTANNPVLSSGEVAFSTDLGKIKIGNGTANWIDLPYIHLTPAELSSSYQPLDSDLTAIAALSASATGYAKKTGAGTWTVDSDYVASLSGTANEVEVSASTGSVTISLPPTINANTTGSAATLTNSRVISLSGDVSGSVTFDGSASVDITTQIQPNSVALGIDTTGNYVATASGGTGISISGSGSEDAAITINNTGVVSLTGTAGQISVSASNGDSTLSFPSAVTFPGTVTLNADPSQALQAATKQYVDSVAEGLHVHASVSAATTASVDLSDAPESVDGVTLTNGMRILVKNQSNSAENGIYSYSASADALVRATDYDSSGEVQAGDFVFVSGGDTYINTGWVQTNNVSTLGTDPISWSQFSGAGTFLAGTGLELIGSTFNNTGVLSLQGTTNEVEVSASSGSITISLPETINANTTGSAATLTTSRTIELTGDISGSASFNGGANASISATLANSGVSASTYGAATSVPVITVDAKGRVTSVTTEAIESLPSQTGNAGKYLTTNGTVASWGTIDLSSYAALSGATFTGVVTGVSASAAGSTSFRNTTMSTSAPTGGSDGDIWLQYS